MISYLSKVWYLLKGSRKSLPFLIFISFVSSILEALGIGLIIPFLNLAANPDYLHKIPFLSWIYVTLNFQSAGQFIALLGILIAIVYCIKSLIYFISQAYIINFSIKQRSKLYFKLLEAYLTVPYTFHLQVNTASFIKNIIIETQNLLFNCLLPLLNSIANLIILIILFLLLAKTNLLFLIMLLGIILPTFLLFYRLRNNFIRWGWEVSQANQEMIRIVNHSLGSIKETRIIGCETHFLESLVQQTEKINKASTLVLSFQQMPRIVTETLLILLVILFIFVSQFFLNQNLQQIASTLAVFAIACIRLFPAASQLLTAMGQLQSGASTVQILYLDLTEVEKEVKTPSLEFYSNLPLTSAKSNENPIMSFTDQIDIQNLTYHYPNTAKPALENISLSLKKGESIGLIGKSGAGKTTLVDVILGLLIPERGDIQVDGVSIYQNTRSWQHLIGYIPQSIFLADDTIERNIAFGVPDQLIDQDKLQKSIADAQLTELVEHLPYGIKTEVGERGVRLSGGQRQRVGIARTLYHQREILVLDEATSALDNETERLVSEAIQTLAKTKTLIVIAHRLSTVEHCDRIYVMEKGQVIQSGNYQETVGYV